MVGRLMRIGNKGFDLDAVAGWRYQTPPEFPNDHVIYLYLSGVTEPMFFEGKEAVQVQTMLNVSSQNITPTK